MRNLIATTTAIGVVLVCVAGCAMIAATDVSCVPDRINLLVGPTPQACQDLRNREMAIETLRLQAERAEREKQQEERTRQQEEADLRAKVASDALSAQQAKLENSPDNVCHLQSVARMLISDMNEMLSRRSPYLQVTDIMHLITTRQSSDKDGLICHGIFIFSSGERIAGYIAYSTNVAGDGITSWYRGTLPQ